MKKRAFTMLEVVFVIVILGILAAVAIPRLAATRDDAEIAKGRSDVAAIRSAIMNERQSRLLQGQSNYVNQLDDSLNYNVEGEILFDDNDSNTSNGGALLQYGLVSANGNGHWLKASANTYTYQVMQIPIVFTYSSTDGTFDCNHTDGNCSNITE